MKDMPALLCAVLSASTDAGRCRAVFDRVIDNGKMLRNFVQIMRSGVVGRKSLGTLPEAPRAALARDAHRRAGRSAASVGQAPSLADVVKMVHPKPATRRGAALYGT